MSTRPRPTFRSVLSQPHIRTLWIASLLSYLGDPFGTMALFVAVNQVTGTTTALGAVGLVQTLPLFLGLIAGTLVDRWRYRPTLLVSDLLRAALYPLYALFHMTADLWFVLLLTFCISCVSRFFAPASQALRRALVQPEEYQITASLWQTTLGLSYVIGPALAGLVIAAFGTTVAFGIDALSFLLSAMLIFVSGRTATQAVDNARQQEERFGAWADLQAGLRVMWASRAIRGSLLLYWVGLLGVGATFVLAVPYIQRIFRGGPFEIGLLDAVQAFGLALGAIGIGTVAATRIPAGTLMLAASLLGSLAVITLGVAPTFVIALVAMLVAGAAAGAAQSAGSAIASHEVPQRHQGKITATQNTILNAAYVTSIAFAGIGGDLIGIRGVFVFGGTIALLGVALATPLLRGAVPPPAVPSTAASIEAETVQ